MYNILSDYKSIITSYNIVLWEFEHKSYRIKLNINFLDTSQLIVKEYLIGIRRKYSYHWQNNRGILKIRWDNAPHWPEIKTFPHHKHINNNIEESHEIDIESVLEHIKKCIKPL